MRQIVFMTDGAVGNENELLQLIARRLGDRLSSRRHRSCAEHVLHEEGGRSGRGTFTFIGDVRGSEGEDGRADPQAREPRAHRRARRMGRPRSETYPRSCPDLYAGEPVILTAAFCEGSVDAACAFRDTLERGVARVAAVVGGPSQPGIGVL
jgi:Ca-activated chloride channel family protein